MHPKVQERINLINAVQTCTNLTFSDWLSCIDTFEQFQDEINRVYFKSPDLKQVWESCLQTKRIFNLY